MYTAAQWKENKALQEEFETWYRSPLAQALRDVLVDLMLHDIPELSREASPLEVEALRGVFQKGEYRMIENLDKLRPSRIIGNEKPPELPRTPTGIPYTPEQQARIDKRMPKPKEPVKVGEV